VASESGSGPPKGLPRVIGSYRVLQELRRDRLGPVLLTRHRATGREVALTVLKPEWACLPRYVFRLVRDAFAVAQVGHPNLVRLVALGESRGRLHFASELVEGSTLAERVGQQGPLPPREAVAHILQAARGLMFAHGQGLVHGDLRPEDIVVDHEGLTRVAGLGLARTPESVAADIARETTGPIALGDRREEETRAAVRTDLHGLGRTLYYLLTRSTPVVDGHALDVLELVARGVPANLAEILGNLINARPGHGYADLGQAITALERYLNASSPGATAPREEHTRTLIECVAAFRASPAATLRRRIVLGGAGACALVVLLSLLAHQPRVAAGFLGLGLMTALAYFVVNGMSARTDLFTKTRGLVLESRGDWLIGLAGLALFATTLVVLHLHWAYIGFGVLGVVLALAIHFEIDRKVESERHEAVAEARALLRALRLQGVAEETLWPFVRTTAGDDWEEFFTALFGSEWARASRAPSDRGLGNLIRKRSLPWRDWLTSWVEDRQETRRLAREKPLLQAIEERGLVAEGVNLLTARRKSRRIAEAMVAVSAELRGAARTPASPPPAGLAGQSSVARAIGQAVDAPEQVLVEREHGRLGPETSLAWDLLLGPRTRFLFGAALLVGCLLWVDQNGIVTGAQIKDVATRAIEHPDPLQALRDTRIDVRVPLRTTPLRLPFLPQPVSNLFHDFNAGAAGLILILSALLSGARVGLFAIPGAAIALFGPALGLPPIGPLDSARTSMALGAGVALLGVFFGKSRGD
jgi:eukaryotic-like serine/threonine-protein kinase